MSQKIDKESIKNTVELAHKFCKEFYSKLGIKIWLAYGSSLGAVRDGGFIDGDLDMDLMVWNEDFVRLKEYICSGGGLPLLPPFFWDFRILSSGGDLLRIEPIGKGCHIDIFPLCKSSDDIRCYNYSIHHLVKNQHAKRWGSNEFIRYPRLHKLYHFENLKKIKFEGLDFYVSKYVEQTLDFIYNGADGTDNTWREPVSYGGLDWDKNISRDKDDKVVGCVMGVFDLFHIGHLRLLERSSRIFDKVVAAVHPDEVVIEYKKKKPVIPYSDRVEIVRSCRFVDEIIEAPLRPHTVEWLNKNSLDYLIHGKTESKFLEEHYSEIIEENRLFLLNETKDYHTTDLIKKISA